MQQAKFSCKENQVEFLNNYKEYGFKDKNRFIHQRKGLWRQRSGIKKRTEVRESPR